MIRETQRHAQGRNYLPLKIKKIKIKSFIQHHFLNETSKFETQLTRNASFWGLKISIFFKISPLQRCTQDFTFSPSLEKFLDALIENPTFFKLKIEKNIYRERINMYLTLPWDFSVKKSRLVVLKCNQ